MHICRVLFPLALVASVASATESLELNWNGVVLNYDVHGNAGGSSFISYYDFWAGGNISPSLTGSGSITPVPNYSPGWSFAVLEIARDGDIPCVDMSRCFVNSINQALQYNYAQLNFPVVGQVSYPTIFSWPQIALFDSSGQLVDVLRFVQSGGASGFLDVEMWAVTDRTAPGFSALAQNFLNRANTVDIVANPNSGIGTTVGVHWDDGGDQVIQFSSTPEPTSIILIATVIIGVGFAAKRKFPGIVRRESRGV